MRALIKSELHRKILTPILLLMVLCHTHANAYPSVADNRYFDKEFASPGAHQLASWIASQLRHNDYLPAQEVQQPILPYRLPIQGKRNSELTNSIIGIPRNMINNGKK